MAIFLLAAFIAVPVIEIILFIEVGGWIGLWPTIAIVVGTAFAGTSLLRIQGLAVLQRAQDSASRNELPVQEVFDGLCLLFAGALLLTPGFLTDALGFTLLVPLFRKVAGETIWRWLSQRGHINFTSFGSASHDSGVPGPVIDGDFEEVKTHAPSKAKLPKEKGG